MRTVADDSISHLISRGIDAGLLPPDAALPARENRPWPLILLTALGVWLAAIPLFAVAVILLGDALRDGPFAYVVGVLLLVAAVTLLRRSEVSLFIEQLALPAMLTGGGLIYARLARDLSHEASALVISALALLLAVPISRAWLRVLLGALAALCLMPLLATWNFGIGDEGWLAAHGILGLGLAALALQHNMLGDARRAPAAIAIEAISTGWIATSLFLLALLSGNTFLVDGALGNGVMQGVGQIMGAQITWLSRAIFALSALLALAAAAWCGWHWRSLCRPLPLAAGLVLAALAWHMPGLGAALLTLAVMGTTRRALPAVAAALTVAWIIGSFYYHLHWPLADKALLLAAAGAVLGAIAWQMYRLEHAGHATVTDARHRAGWLMMMSALLTLVVVNVAIRDKEHLIAHGAPVFVALAPVDPRSLMQGDFMRLHFRLPEQPSTETSLMTGRPHVVAQRDARGVATLLRIQRPGESLQPGEFLIELTPKNGSWALVTDAWFFKEGDAARWEQARFGEFRVLPEGKALLVGMADAELRAIHP